MATGGYYQYGHHSLWTSFEEMGAALVKFSINWKDVLPVEYDEQRCLVCEEVKDFRRHDIPELGYLCSDGCLLNIWYLVLRTLKYKNKGLVCKLPGCIHPVVKDASQKYDYCGYNHAGLHKVKLQNAYRCEEIVQCSLPDCQWLCPKRSYYSLPYCCQKHQQTTLYCVNCPKDKGDIRFYNSDDRYYEFSNFYQYAPITIGEKKWRSTEHYFQAQKFIGTPYEDEIQKCSTPRMALDTSRKFDSWKRGDWNETKFKVMYVALLAKFSQHERLRALLHSTGKRKLVEHTLSDKVWGDGGDGRGENYLGRLLMDVRHVIGGHKENKTVIKS